MARFIEKLTTLFVKKINTADCYGDRRGGGLWPCARESEAKSWIFRFNFKKRALNQTWRYTYCFFVGSKRRNAQLSKVVKRKKSVEENKVITETPLIVPDGFIVPQTAENLLSNVRCELLLKAIWQRT